MIVYMTENLINGKRYIGRDMFNNPDYLGSGKLLQKAITKYGRENFKKNILQYCNSIEELKEAENNWIQKFNAAHDTMFYNILDGSSGGDSLSNHPDLENIKTKIRTARSKQNICHSEETKRKISESQKGELSYWYKKERPAELNQRVSQTMKGVSKKIISCPHCGKSGGNSQMKRWHFDQCSTVTGKKHKPTNKQPWNKGLKNPYSAETIKKMSESHKNK